MLEVTFYTDFFLADLGIKRKSPYLYRLFLFMGYILFKLRDLPKGAAILKVFSSTSTAYTPWPEKY